MEVSSSMPPPEGALCYFGTLLLCYFGTVFPNPLILQILNPHFNRQRKTKNSNTFIRQCCHSGIRVSGYPESRVLRCNKHNNWVPASAGMTSFCSMPIYRRFYGSSNNTLRLSAQNLMNQAATCKLSALSHQHSVEEKNKSPYPLPRARTDRQYRFEFRVTFPFGEFCFITLVLRNSVTLALPFLIPQSLIPQYS